MRKKLFIFFILLCISSFYIFAENKSVNKKEKKEDSNLRSFFFYTRNEHFKTDFTVGYTYKKYSVKDNEINYNQGQLSIDWDVLWFPFLNHSFIFCGGLDVKVPLTYERKWNGQTQKLKNFEGGMYTTFSPYLVTGFSFDLGKSKKTSLLFAGGAKYDQTAIRSIDDVKQKLTTISAMGMVNLRFHFNQRYSFCFSGKYEHGLKHWIEKKDREIESSGITIQAGLSYDF